MLLLYKVLKFVIKHPLNKGKKIESVLNYFRWQLGSRLIKKPIVINFVNKSRIIYKRGMSSSAGILYTGLPEFEEMSFVLHLLRKNDLMIDIGANIGIYTILAGGGGGHRR